MLLALALLRNIQMTPIDLVALCLTSFLIGINIAMLVQFWEGMTSWFSFKIFAIIFLLIYIALSVSIGRPSWWRAGIAVVACLVDCIAVRYVWIALDSAKNGHLYVRHHHDHK